MVYAASGGAFKGSLLVLAMSGMASKDMTGEPTDRPSLAGTKPCLEHPHCATLMVKLSVQSLSHRATLMVIVIEIVQRVSTHTASASTARLQSASQAPLHVCPCRQPPSHRSGTPSSL